MEKVAEYQLKKETQALEPKYDQYGNLCTVVYELFDTYMVNKSPRQIIEDSCIFYGCEYGGRLEAAKKILGIKQMVPICVSVSLGLYVMPTCSPESDKCYWLSLDHLEKIEEYQTKSAKVTFTNQKSLILDVHRDTLEARKAKMALLYYMLTKRVGMYAKWEDRLGLNELWRLL
jgi:competence protein ComK